MRLTDIVLCLVEIMYHNIMIKIIIKGMRNLVTHLQDALIGLTSATEAFIDIFKFVSKLKHFSQVGIGGFGLFTSNSLYPVGLSTTKNWARYELE